MADVRGVVHEGRDDLNDSLRWIAEHTNRSGRTGSLKEAVAGRRRLHRRLRPNVLDGRRPGHHGRDAIVFALANPDPEVDPAVARQTAAVVATGRSDFPNQINNVLVFPGVFRGLLTPRAAPSTPR
ncbi:hypothetical protein GCM10020229_15540 [Kitasatospora albolonga]